MKGLPRDDTGSGEGSLHRSFFEVPIEASGKPSEVSIWLSPTCRNFFALSAPIDFILFRVVGPYNDRRCERSDVLFFLFFFTCARHGA